MAPRPDLLARVRVCLQQHVRPGDRLRAGFSGGLDSTVLLHLLAALRGELGFSLSAMHVHHGLSPQADAWAGFCRQTCDSLGIPCRVERVTVRLAGEGVEAAARSARYAAYASQDVDHIVLAHHQDDQAETVLLHLLRGAGVRGLAAMPLSRRLSAGGPCLLRPLLGIPRAELEAHAVAHGLGWVEDESNAEVAYGRNFLRHVVLPQLATRFPGYRSTLHRAAAHLGECAGLLDDLAAQDGAGAVNADGLAIARLRELPLPRARNLLRWYLAGLGEPAWPSVRLEAVLAQLLSVGPDNHFSMPLVEGGLRLWQGRLLRTDDGVPEQAAVDWHGEDALPFAGGRLEFRYAVGAGVSVSRLAGLPVSLRLRQGGEHLQPDCGRPRRPLKKLLQEHGVPPWQRARLPLLEVAGEVVWAALFGVDCAWQAGEGEPGLLIDWQPQAPEGR